MRIERFSWDRNAPLIFHDDVVDAITSEAAGVLFRTKTHMLLMKRADTGEWSIPAGNLEKNETPLHGAQREAAEETGYPGDHRARHAHTAVTRGVKFHTFVQPAEWQFAPILNPEHTKHAWVRPSKLPAPLHPGLVATLHAMSEGGGPVPLARDAFDPNQPRDPLGRWAALEQRGDKLIGYHGTSDEVVEAIKREGLKPHASAGADEWAKKYGMTAYQEFISGDRISHVYFADDAYTALSFSQLAAEVRKSKPALFEIDLPISEAPKVSADERGQPGMLKYSGEIKPEWLKEIKLPKRFAEQLMTAPRLMEATKDANTKRIYAIVFEPKDGD